jgi:hypothetical protein
MSTPREAIMHHDNPDRAKLVWESATGPVLVEEMTAVHLRNAIAFAERVGFESEALPTMRDRLRRLQE